ncbi:MAG: CehA/McbA family metallohydrolase [Syntrophales bacterium]
MMGLYDYSGVIHFHSEYSHDGRVSIPDILKAARKNGVDFLMLTDHEHLRAKKAGEEGWHGKTLLIVGEEISPQQFNHYLVFGLSEPLGETVSGDHYHQDLINRVRDSGGIGFIAHPDHEGTKMFHVKQYAWMNWAVSGYCGMSIWDFMTDWQSSLKGYWSGFLGYLFPALVLKGPKRVTLERWDRLNRTEKVVGIGELDNHDTPHNILGITFSVFPFRRAFRFVRTHILTEIPMTGNKDADIKTVYDSLRAGRAYATLAYWGSSKGFGFFVSDGEKSATTGGEFVLRDQATIKVMVPDHARIRVFRNGGLYLEGTGRTLEGRIVEEGVYRTECFIRRFGKERPWIFSNPIYVK